MALLPILAYGKYTHILCDYMNLHRNLVQCDVVLRKIFSEAQELSSLSDHCSQIAKHFLMLFQPRRQREIYKRMRDADIYVFKFKYFPVFIPIYVSKLSFPFQPQCQELSEKRGMVETTETEIY